MALFGGSSTPAFGSASPFGGASSTPAFGQQPSTPAFGQQPATPAVPSFGSFGSSTSAFGSAASTPAFGSTPTNNAFGAPSTPAFGSATPNAFGASSTPAFGAASTPAFGAGTPSAFGSSTPAFGAATPSTGFGTFGSTASTPAFGGGTSLFSSQPQMATWNTNTQAPPQPAELKPETKVRDLPQPLQEQLFACEKFLQSQRLASAKLRIVSTHMDTNTMKTNQLTEKYFVNLKRSLANLRVFQKHLASLRSVLGDERRNYDGIFSALASHFSGNGNDNMNSQQYQFNQHHGRIPAAYFDNVVNDMEKRANEYRKEIEEISDFLSTNPSANANMNYNGNYNGNMQGNNNNKAGLEVVIQRQYKYFMHVASQIARLHDEITRLVEFFREFRAKRMPLADDPFQLADSQDRAKSQRLRLLAEKRMLEAARKTAAQQQNPAQNNNANNNSAFGAQSTPSLFGNPGGAASTPGLFGGGAQSAPSLFGNPGGAASTPSTGLFGGAQSAPSLFGNPGAALTTPSTGIFGASSAAAAPSGGLFGAAPAPAAQSGGLFGSATPSSGGGLFGSATPSSGTAFGATPASTPSLFGGGSNGAFDSQPGTRRRKR